LSIGWRGMGPDMAAGYKKGEALDGAESTARQSRVRTKEWGSVEACCR